jgi:hypothetical protein
LYGCEIWSLISNEDHRVRVFEKRVLKIIFGHKRDEGIAGCRKKLITSTPLQVLSQ